jgi:CheY-like chemotaxis protein
MHVWLADDECDNMLDDIRISQMELSRDEVELSDVSIEGINSPEGFAVALHRATVEPDNFPDIIFLDLSFDSREEGLNALKAVKYHPDRNIRKIPVIMYSQSDLAEDVYVTANFRANAYLTKGGIAPFWGAVRHWLSAKVPPHRCPKTVVDDLQEPEARSAE